MIAPVMDSISVFLPARTSCSMDEILSFVARHIASASSAAFLYGRSMPLMWATSSASLAASCMTSVRSLLLRISPLVKSDRAVMGLIAALMTSLLHSRDVASSCGDAGIPDSVSRLANSLAAGELSGVNVATEVGPVPARLMLPGFSNVAPCEVVVQSILSGLM